MKRLFQADATANETPVDGLRVLQTLSERWRAAQTLDYQSRVVMSHAGEFRAQIAVSVLLRRPRQARIVWDADRDDVSRLRVCDGRAIYERTRGSGLRRAQSLREGLNANGQVTQNVPHPLDEASYCVDQFFSPNPFWPPKTWGEGIGAIDVSAVRVSKPKAVYRITLLRGKSRDTITLDAQNYAPLEVVRVGDHAGRVQELLRETFTLVRLGTYLPASLFTWIPPRDEGPGATYLSAAKSGAGIGASE